jgi:phosphotransferase system enzyme I (PtsI)
MGKKEQMKKIKGLSISSGKVIAKVCVYSQVKHKSVMRRSIDTEKDAVEEIRRFEDAIAACSKEIDEMVNKVRREIGDREAEIYIAQKHIVNDPVIKEEVKKRVLKDRKNVEIIIDEVFKEYEEKFASLDNKYISERSSDISDINGRLLNYLLKTQPGFDCEGQEHCQKGMERIIVAKELTTDMMVHMNLSHVYGIVTEHGGATSHAAIIARAAGIPAVSGVIGIYNEVSCGVEILLDGDNGTVIIRPDKETADSVIQADAVEMKKGHLLLTPEGMEVLANASLIEDVEQAVSMYADGIGLFRTELLFIRMQHLLAEEEQFQFYSKVTEIMKGKPVTFRLLDVGGDKELAFLKPEREINPYLSLRGSRFLLANQQIFITQLRALVRLSTFGKVRILFPMIIDNSQVDKILTSLKEVITTVESIPENIISGVMFEVPSACLQAEDILKKVDFACIGSNDLIQYLFAVERDNEFTSQDFNPAHPVLWNIMKNLGNVAKHLEKPISICGEMAGKKEMVSRFLNAGITSLSVSPRLIPRVRNEMEKYVSNSRPLSQSASSRFDSP